MDDFSELRKELSGADMKANTWNCKEKIKTVSFVVEGAVSLDWK